MSFSWGQTAIIIVIGLPVLLLLIYLVARLVTSAYFRSKMAYIRKGITEKI